MNPLLERARFGTVVTEVLCVHLIERTSEPRISLKGHVGGRNSGHQRRTVARRPCSTDPARASPRIEFDHELGNISRDQGIPRNDVEAA
jgi:hypothetical protein